MKARRAIALAILAFLAGFVSKAGEAAVQVTIVLEWTHGGGTTTLVIDPKRPYESCINDQTKCRALDRLAALGLFSGGDGCYAKIRRDAWEGDKEKYERDFGFLARSVVKAYIRDPKTCAEIAFNRTEYALWQAQIAANRQSRTAGTAAELDRLYRQARPSQGIYSDQAIVAHAALDAHRDFETR